MFLNACAGKYIVKSFPADAKLYLKDINTNEKKLIGNTPTQIEEDGKLGEVFFIVLEKDNYKPKEIMVKVNEGESLSISAKMDPLSPADLDNQNLAKKKDDDQKNQGSPNKEKEPKDWQKEFEDLRLRVALLENTSSFTKEALFSPRLSGGVSSQDRDRKERVIAHVFDAQKSIRLGRFDEALKSIDSALQLDEYSTNAWLLKGSASYLKKDYTGARNAWERTLKLDPYNKAAFRYLNSVYKLMNVQPLVETAADLREPASTLEIKKRQEAKK
ncbi:MAG: hypothetical protein HUU56_02865 [Bdellovibrionaceae bacterium]|nr:hypothetical protein [Pseudobdellovibrionaceae bacterium]